MSVRSIKVKAGIAAAVLFAAGLAVAGAVSFFAMSAISEQSHTEQMSLAVNEGLDTLKGVHARMDVYADFLSRHPEIVAAMFIQYGQHGATASGYAAKAINFYLDRKYGREFNPHPIARDGFAVGSWQYAPISQFSRIATPE